ncbi:adenosylcobinamide amidohydrolase [Halorubrum vacuolatum]|uniref:Adenosylcobinamide hydrolase n=1 Tax=Halorubrum vacuolatum TaxID=63740 RepID=A0A238XW93_HALVU|nr:adenosylcobinamide amidohydrolase [Halorubrum vacuolatum]SNR62259.1 adenosylcobinamide hydrolase [Halorubrum vacuolatum]
MSFVVGTADGVTRLSGPDTRFLSTGFDGGFSRGTAAYNVTVPEGWGEEGPRDLRAYATGRIEDAGFDPARDAPILLTGVETRHARVARLDSVVAVATVGLSNPAALPVDTDWLDHTGEPKRADADGIGDGGEETRPPPGTVNLMIGTTRALPAGALANLVAVAAEAKATTLIATTGFPGTTSDAMVVGCETNGTGDRFSGPATPVGSAVRACVRDAVLASLRSRYAEEPIPESVAAAEHGVVTDRRAAVTAVDGDPVG